ncbi:methyltransferase domain-containing protein [Candidatus Dojkabacteria bacterium]|nr:methyltransferase domain-containing protein [Candidatus Dojkabacteria bacterium]
MVEKNNDELQKQKEYHNKTAQEYDFVDKIISRENRNHIKKLDKIIDLLRLEGTERILEIGIGSAIHAKHLMRRFPSLDFHGIDISYEMIKISEDKLKKYNRVTLTVDNGQKTKFPDNCFDCVFYATTLHHIPDPVEAVKEVKRILKPGGRAVFMEPNRLFPKNTWEILTIPEERGMLQITKKNMKKWGEMYGFRTIEVGNFLYTLPFPKALFPLYDRIDAILEKIPILKKFSFMVYFYGEA